ncbi:hypothetical protein MKJ04_09635 [Pontibacter sp. E15-1]|uniref:hypothetical protein n=1 Tax=Pontibacter sp. E15-1 TaxID=2919918 RepID=UPI001F4F158E|nr:hypothetical protein [Pontibacter sp. E15-1]MCJ8165103.1 hypothetical protein [Pontibacter sp. E15-1]
MQALAEEMEGISWLWLSQELEVRDIVLLRRLCKQTFVKGSDYLTCPIGYL